MMESTDVVPLDVFLATSNSAWLAIMRVQVVTDMRISLFLLLALSTPKGVDYVVIGFDMEVPTMQLDLAE